MIILSIFALLSTIMTKLFYILAQNTRLVDKPNERSLHLKPTVRGGGVVFIGLSLISLTFLSYFTGASLAQQIVLIFSIFLLATISFIDDLYQLSAKSRFLVQCIVALSVSLFLRPEILDFGVFIINTRFLIVPFLFFAVIWAINHFNFMDGLDGLCALQAIFLFASYALLFSIHDALLYQEFCFVLIGSLFGFLIFNFPPAKLFMGDIGSATLGFITFCLAVIAQQKFQIPIIYWFILNGLFLFDATITLIRRVINKEKFSVAHRKHAYQRLKQYGLDTRLILLGQIFINASFLLGILLLHNNNLSLSILLFFMVGLMSLIYYFIEKLFPMFQTIKL
ncbi:glycosyl transferase [Legionella antarctica]|uniref:Glycosyl transferase n=1 Tax=Legionella antarctica TaxID=2708020 RepID=A0A6F8T4K1_9GAMM|nr:glycosyl transferase [Legionella antarctica]